MLAPKKARIWYLLEWDDRDKCLLLAVGFALLQLCYWLLIEVAAQNQAFAAEYLSATGLVTTRWVCVLCELLWLALVAWGWWLRQRHIRSPLYVTATLYLICIPLIATGHMMGLYNPVLGVMLLGGSLTGCILFDFRRIAGPFVLATSLVLLLAFMTITQQLEYAPLMKQLPVNKDSISALWVLLMFGISLPFVATAFLVTHLLLARWKEREEMAIQLALVDTLTKLPNRRSFFEQTERQLARAARKGLSVAVVMMDLDHFKNTNDSWGHAAGDKVLKKIGEQLPTKLRQGDLVGRIGGEEFAILLADTAADTTQDVIERCRKAVEAMDIVIDSGKHIHITASFGICYAERVENADLEPLLAKADKALYQAKDAGRNCVKSIIITA